jgi:hypothetical protein
LEDPVFHDQLKRHKVTLSQIQWRVGIWSCAMSTNLEPSISLAAARMRRHRQRRREGLRCLVIELRETEVEALIRYGLLKCETRNDSIAVRDALYEFLDRTLGGIR